MSNISTVRAFVRLFSKDLLLDIMSKLIRLVGDRLLKTFVRLV